MIRASGVFSSQWSVVSHRSALLFAGNSIRLFTPTFERSEESREPVFRHLAFGKLRLDDGKPSPLWGLV